MPSVEPTEFDSARFRAYVRELCFAQGRAGERRGRVPTGGGPIRMAIIPERRSNRLSWSELNDANGRVVAQMWNMESDKPFPPWGMRPDDPPAFLWVQRVGNGDVRASVLIVDSDTNLVMIRRGGRVFPWPDTQSRPMQPVVARWVDPNHLGADVVARVPWSNHHNTAWIDCLPGCCTATDLFQ